jgi:hypothetical protein
MDPDMNKYDLEHVVTGHDTMSKAEWEGIYDRAWHLYYSWEHIETLIKRALATGIKPARLAVMIFNFYACYLYERVHPLQSGVFRRKIRADRRSGMPIENPAVFYPRRAWEILRTYRASYSWLSNHSIAQAVGQRSTYQGLSRRRDIAAGTRCRRAGDFSRNGGGSWSGSQSTGPN